MSAENKVYLNCRAHKQMHSETSRKSARVACYVDCMLRVCCMSLDKMSSPSWFSGNSDSAKLMLSWVMRRSSLSIWLCRSSGWAARLETSAVCGDVWSSAMHKPKSNVEITLSLPSFRLSKQIHHLLSIENITKTMNVRHHMKSTNEPKLRREYISVCVFVRSPTPRETAALAHALDAPFKAPLSSAL